ncbi:unnamed protein product [Rodentolepis nana]|uniref:Arrestin_N domain-containing protein n=1 Tax=Rodentolepis nana TaxID=102285 RepID=A0A0R3T986_RODNA|nr:unnamed protein product [Rodentolepis nana]
MYDCIKIPKSAVGRLYMSLRLQSSENSDASILLKIHIKEVKYLPLNQSSGSSFLKPNRYYVEAELKAVGPKPPTSSFFPPYALNSESRMQGFRYLLHSLYDGIGSVRTDIAEGFHSVHFDQTLILQVPKLTFGLSDETHSNGKADAQKQYELHMTLFHCGHSDWYRRDTALGSSPIALSSQLLQNLSSNIKQDLIIDLFPTEEEQGRQNRFS